MDNTGKERELIQQVLERVMIKSHCEFKELSSNKVVFFQGERTAVLTVERWHLDLRKDEPSSQLFECSYHKSIDNLVKVIVRFFRSNRHEK